MAQAGIKVLPVFCSPLASAHSVPQVALAETHLEGMGGDHCSMCLSGVKPLGFPPSPWRGVAPLPQ